MKSVSRAPEASATTGRLARLRTRLARAKLPALLVTYLPNISYLSGFRGSAGALLISRREQVLFSDFRYRLQVAQQAPGFRFVEVQRNSLASMAQEAKRLGFAQVGFEAHQLTVEQLRRLRAGARGVRWQPAGELVEGLRQVKEPAEIAQIARAARITDRAFAYMRSLLAIGKTEREIALAGQLFMLQAGAKEMAFDLIVGAGAHGALPHAQSGPRRIKHGDLVVIDIGLRLPSGYCSDLTRTVAVGRAADWQREIHAIVQAAQQRALQALRPGAVAAEVDGVARAVITEAGYGEYFGHGLGHGVGLEVHEGPRLAATDRTVLRTGMVVTVEPGIYLPGRGGVRLEELVVIAPHGYRLLSHAPNPKKLPVIQAGEVR